MKVYLSLYKTIYNDNKYFSYTWKCISHYTRRCIIECLLSLYIFIYNDNKHFSHSWKYISPYMRQCIKTTNISIIHKVYFSLYRTMYNDNIYLLLYDTRRTRKIFIIIIHDEKYIFMYKKNICFCYTRRCIMIINILLYKMYNKIFVSVIQEDV